MLQNQASPAPTQNERANTASEIGLYGKMLMDLETTIGTLECLSDSDTPRHLAANLTEWVQLQIVALQTKLQEMKVTECLTPVTA